MLLFSRGNWPELGRKKGCYESPPPLTAMFPILRPRIFGHLHPQLLLQRFTSLRSEKLQNESSPNFSNFHPEFCPEACSDPCPIWLDDRGTVQWRKFRAVPRLYPLRSLVCTLFTKGGSRGASRLPGASGDHFHCTVEPSPGHIGCRSESSPNFLRSFCASFRGKRRPDKIHQRSALRSGRVKFAWDLPFFTPFSTWNFGWNFPSHTQTLENVAQKISPKLHAKFHDTFGREKRRKISLPHFCRVWLLWQNDPATFIDPRYFSMQNS